MKKTLVVACLLVICGCLALPQAEEPELSVAKGDPDESRQARLSEDGFSPFFFTTMGDNRPHGAPEKVIQPPMFKQAIREINLLGSEFTIIIGDLILGYEKDMELVNREWDEYFKTCKSFKKPYYSVIGNHDVWNKESEKLFKERVGPLYFAFSHKGCRLICLNGEDTDKSGFIYGKQLDWLKQELEEYKDVKYIFVFLHKPLWREGYNVNWNEEVHPLLAKYKVNTVFAGHEHRYELSEPRDGIRYIVTGGAGAEIGDSEICGDFFHHLWVHVQADEVRVAVIKTGSVCPEDVITQKWVEQVNAFSQSVTSQPFPVTLGQPSKQAFGFTTHNPFDQDITLRLSLKTQEDSGWVSKGTDEPITVKPGQSIEISLEVSFDGENLFPLPETHTECFLGDKKLLDRKGPLTFTLERTFSIKKTTGRIVIDGKLDETSWLQAGKAGKWIDMNALTGWATQSTDWRVCYDEQFLYLAFECQEDLIEQVSQVAQDRDWQSLAEPSIIFYLDPIKDGVSRFCLGITSFGVKMDFRALSPQRDPDFNWNAEWSAKVIKDKGSYTVEIAIPFKVLDREVPQSGTEWGINAYRLCLPSGYTVLDGWNIPRGELSNPAGYGTLVFE